MEISIEQDLTFEEYKMLRNTTTWATLTDKQIEKLIEHSTFKVRARIDDKTVGMGRVLFDFGYNSLITDIVVDPGYQGKGIGKLIVETLIQLVKNESSGNEYLQFNLLAAPGKSGFYEKLGFVKRDETNGYGMNLRLNAK
jgi:GNAT superfamily N-acetyltransferase